MSENQKYYCMCIQQGTATSSRAALLKNSRWQTGGKLTIRFLDGSPELQARVKKVALEWTKVANLIFEFVDAAPSDIRVGFTQGNGSWSYIGTTCRNIAEPSPTMNYGWLTTGSDEVELRRVVLHEFGHAIGLIHEHQNPNGGIHWDKAAVTKDLSGPPNNWDLPTIENNMFKFYEPSALTATDADPLSIMMYPIPKSWTTDGFSAGLNSEISDEDKLLVGNVYLK